MTLAEIVVITGLPGLYKLVAKRNDGLVVTSLLDDKTTFVSGRKHLFTTLDNVTMYTTGEGISLKSVLTEMKKQEAIHPPTIQNDKEAKAYFEKIVPDYDREKVYVSDIKKLIKWYEILNNKNLIEELIKTSSESANVPVEEQSVENTEEKAAKKSATTENHARLRKEAKPKGEKTVKTTSKPALAAKKVSAPRKAQ